MRIVAPILLFAGVVSEVAAQSIRDYQFEVESLGGQTLRHADFAKSVLIVDYWGTWCPPCRDAVPVLQKLYAKYKHHGLEIVGLCYEGPGEDPAATVRKFATDAGITYHLALGTPALKRAVPDFGGYPTMLFFGRELQFDHLQVGFTAEHEVKIEDWIRTALGLEALDRTRAAAVEPAPEEAAAADEAALRLPVGVVFQPGDGDTGFDFEAKDVDGKALRFADLRGKPVLLALTSTWDASAATTAVLLAAVHGAHADDVHVVGACLELRASDEKKAELIRAFREAHGLKFPLFPAGHGFQKKVHQFSGMPMFLVFDQEGVLVLREAGADATADDGKGLDAVKEKIETSLAGLLKH